MLLDTGMPAYQLEQARDYGELIQRTTLHDRLINLAKNKRALKLKFTSMTAELGTLECQTQRKGAELIKLEMQMSEFWKKK